MLMPMAEYTWTVSARQSSIPEVSVGDQVLVYCSSMAEPELWLLVLLPVPGYTCTISAQQSNISEVGVGDRVCVYCSSMAEPL